MRVIGVLLSVVLATPLLTRAADKDKDPAPPPYDIPRLDDIKIDGDDSDWKSAGFRIDAFAPADGHIVPTTDFDATCRVAWNAQGLLVLVHVADDDLQVSNQSDSRLAEGDSVEFVVSAREGLTAQYVIAPGVTDGAAPRAYAAYLANGRPLENGNKLVAAARRTAAGYVVEALLPNDAYSKWAQAADDVQFTVSVNDVDAKAPRRRHAPLWLAPRPDAVPEPAMSLRPGKSASPPFAAAISIVPLPGQGHARATVVADSTAAGRSVEFRLGPPPLKLNLAADDKPPLPAIAAERIGRLAGRWGAAFTFPLPPIGANFGPVNVYVDSVKIARVTLPSNDAERINALSQFDLNFKPAIFAGDQFPPCDFTAPAAARDLIGPYSFKYTFYDADRNVVERPHQPGRYGAVVEIVTAAGNKIPKRLVTLFHQSDPPGWQDEQFDARIAALPPQFGIDPKVVAAQQKVLGEHARYLLPDALLSDVDTPLLLSALYESKPGDPPLAGRNSIWARSERWWYPIKQQRHRASYQYVADVPRLHLNTDPPLPVLLCLHGSGERGDDLAAVRTHGPPKLVAAGKEFPFLVVAPQCPAGEWWNARQLIDVLDDVATKHRIDPDRIYLTGISMGGYGVWELAAEYPDRFAAIVPICGAGGPADAEQLKNLPTWAFHGMQDHDVPFNRTIEMVTALKKVGGRVRFTPYPDLGHDCWTRTYDNPQLYEWLLKQKRGAPAEIPAAPAP
jgi:predicted esterase